MKRSVLVTIISCIVITFIVNFALLTNATNFSDTFNSAMGYLNTVENSDQNDKLDEVIQALKDIKSELKDIKTEIKAIKNKID